MRKRVLGGVGVALLAGGMAKWWLHAPAPHPVFHPAATVATSTPSPSSPGSAALVTPAAPGKLPPSTGRLVASPLAHASLTPGAVKSSPANTLWQRLANPIIVATEVRTLADGTMRRAHLLRVEAKYPNVVFEGILPGNNPQADDQSLLRPIARVADHVIVSPRPGVTEPEFRRVLISKGLQPMKRLTPDGPFLVKLPQASIPAVDQAIAALRGESGVAYSEPDYLLQAADLPEKAVPVDFVNGVETYPQSALDASTQRPPAAPVFESGTLVAATEERLSALPSGARVLTFDPPTFTGGQAQFNPYLEEQNMLVSTDSGAYVQGAYTPGYPNNGTSYTRSLSSEGNYTIKHREGLPFTLLSLDLSEYSTVFTSPKAVTFTGYKANGTTVSQTMTTDGIIDGTGPLNDFQTFTFNSNFTGLVKVIANTTGFMIDNVALLVEGQESSPPPSPTPPLIYDVTWDAPKHTVGKQIDVGGGYAPSSINFGTPTVRAQVGTLVGPALELNGSGYQQIRFGLNRAAESYKLAFDTYLSAPLVLQFDGAGGVQSLTFNSNGVINVYQSSGSGGTVSAASMAERTTHIEVAVDMVNRQWQIFVNGSSVYKGVFYTTTGDLTDVRFHTSGGLVGVDNIRISAFGADTSPTLQPKLTLYSESMNFPSKPLGSTMRWYLSLYNKGGQTVTIPSIVSSNGSFQVQSIFPISIVPGGNFSVPIDFSPQVSGSLSGTLLITSNDPVRPTISVPVSGFGTGVPRLQLTPANLLVTMLADTTGLQNFTISNPGADTLWWNLVVKGVATQSGPATDPATTPNDSQFSSLWAMRSAASGLGGIDATHAWSVTTGSPATVIAVIDSGIDLTHPELAGNFYVNAGEIPGNNIDDDKNGYIDDVKGWDFANDDADPTDDAGHGTHVAGTIAARGNNGTGVAGLCWRARLLPVKFLSDRGSGYTSDAVSAVSYAGRMGARISNNSWGGGGYSQALYDVIDSTGRAGALFVAAAGNDNRNTDTQPNYPSGYALDNIVSVAATDEQDSLSYFSNYGAASVDLGAPGSNILSLRPGGGYALLSGTSMASPHVAGVAGLLLAQNADLTPTKLKQLLMFGSDSNAALGNRVASQGRLNAYRALKASIPPWLQPSLTSGSIATGQSTVVPLRVNTASLLPGTYNLTIALSSNDPIQPTVDLPVVLKVLAPTNYNQWVFGNFAGNQMLYSASESSEWSDPADPDHDGMSNLLEFISGSDPVVSELAKAPVLTRRNGELIYEFLVRQTLEGASYAVQWSDSLTQPIWQSTGLTTVENTLVDSAKGIRRLRVKLTSNRGQAYFRLVGSRVP